MGLGSTVLFSVDLLYNESEILIRSKKNIANFKFNHGAEWIKKQTGRTP